MTDETSTEAIEASRKFWNHATSRVRRDAPLSSFSTLTESQGVAALRDELEQAQIMRHLRISPSARVLDLGGGAGRFALPLARRAAHVTLVDLSDALLQVARERASREGIANIRYVRAPVQHFEFEGQYDLILVMNVAMYLNAADLDALAARCARALRPGGKLLLKEPVTTDGSEREQFGTDPEHRYHARFRPREVYREVFGRELRWTAQTPTLSHPFPWFVSGTEGATRAASGPAAAWLLDRARPLLVAADPWLLRAELAIRAQPRLRPLLSPVPIVQDLYVFEPRAIEEPASAEAPALSVVVIAFNEEACLADVAIELMSALDEAAIDYELVMVDDGSNDGTLRVMKQLTDRGPRIRVVPLRPNRGIGGALRAGFDTARGKHITWVPADGQIAPQVVVELYGRRHDASMLTTVYRERADHWFRTLLSSSLNGLIKLQTGKQVKSGGNYLFAREAWLRCAPPADDSMMISTAFREQLRQSGQPIMEVPIDCRARVAGQSKVLNPRTIWRTLRALSRMGRGAQRP